MRPFPFSYHRPETLDTAFDDLDRYRDDVALYAGGTELLLAMKARVLRYGHLVDLKRISELAGVRLDGNVIVIGALTTHHQLGVNPLLNSHFPTYARLSNHVANIRVRCAGTLGGNLCFAEPHADPPAMLATLEASVTLRDRGTERSVSVADFIKSEFTTARRDGEILTEIRVPMPLAGASYSYDKVGHLSRPAVTLAAGRIPAKSGARYRIWAGAIGDRPIKIESVETALAGVSDTDLQEVLPAAARTAAESLPATDDLYGSADYKRHLASVLIQRTVRQLANEVSGNVH